VHILLSEIENIIPDAIFRKTGGPSDYNRESIISRLYEEIILNSNDNLDFFIALHDKCPRNLYIMNCFKTMYYPEEDEYGQPIINFMYKRTNIFDYFIKNTAFEIDERSLITLFFQQQTESLSVIYTRHPELLSNVDKQGNRRPYIPLILFLGRKGMPEKKEDIISMFNFLTLLEKNAVNLNVIDRHGDSFASNMKLGNNFMDIFRSYKENEELKENLPAVNTKKHRL